MYVYIYISCVATLLDQQSAELNKVKERNIRSICRQQLFGSLRAHQYSSDQKKIDLEGPECSNYC